MKRRLYFAYGSNLNTEQMKLRCPDSEVFGTVNLPDYQLLFRGRNGNSVATIEPKSGGSVPGLLWLVPPRDEAALDRYEGWPVLYRKEEISVGYGNRQLRAFVYIINDGLPLGAPCTGYYKTIQEGYREFGLKLSVLRKAAKYSAKNAPHEPFWRNAP